MDARLDQANSLIGQMFCVKRYIRKFLVFSSVAIIVLSTIIRKLYFYRMLLQTIVKMSSNGNNEDAL